jgi:hypothetical protein
MANDAQLLHELKKVPSLRNLLYSFDESESSSLRLKTEELVLLFIWTRPLVTTVATNDQFTQYARGILGVDVIQAQGLLRNCPGEENHLLVIVETYMKLANSLPGDEFLGLLRNAVYSRDKALELKATLSQLGENWFGLKEDIKSKKMSEAPKVEGT